MTTGPVSEGASGQALTTTPSPRPAPDDGEAIGVSLHCSWDVTVFPRENDVMRKADITRPRQGSDRQATESMPEELIWPVWPATVTDVPLAASPLAELERDWATAGNRLRDSAKWMATVLGLALATVVGSSPLADLAIHHLQVTAFAILAGGLAFLGVTMLLILRVLQPQAVSYTEIENPRPLRGIAAKKYIASRWPVVPFLSSPLFAWKENIGKHKDLYLPCDVTSLRSLRESMSLEQATLSQLTETGANPATYLTTDRLRQVQAARAARLAELRAAAARITSIGECYELKARSIEAMYWGTICASIGTAAIVLAFAWPLR